MWGLRKKKNPDTYVCIGIFHFFWDKVITIGKKGISINLIRWYFYPLNLKVVPIVDNNE